MVLIGLPVYELYNASVSSEIAKEKSLLAGLIISMPTITVLALIWLYWDTHDIQQVKNLIF